MNPKIVIVGAGVAGVAAATKLYENGFYNITVLEGESRIGGRVHTIPFGTNFVDLGAQWCHGEKDNVVFELANKLDCLESASTKYNQFEYRRSNGEIIDQQKGDKLTELAMSIVENNKDKIKDFPGSFGHFIVHKFTDTLRTDNNYKDIELELANEFLEFFQKYENSIEASDTWYDTSAEGYLHYWDCEGDRLLNWKNRGYKTILDILLKKFPDDTTTLPIESKIQLNKSVSNIDWNKVDKPTVIKCIDGSLYEADHTIITVSLGVLKERHLTMFSPTLPRSKITAIEGLTLGTVDKIYIEFAKPFWDEDWTGFSILWKSEDLDKLRYTPNEWLRYVFGFYTVDYNPNVLCGWISGVYARKMELLPNEDIKNGVMSLLRQFIKNCEIPEPIRVQNSAWYSNPHFRGSYSYRSVTTDILKTSAADLAFPLQNSVGVPILQFAGEATHDHYYSTVHGALESGWREAKRIIDLYKKETKSATNDNFYDIIILGGGISGLGAAVTLSKSHSNKSFIILEGQSKYGGRISTVEMKSYGKICQEKCFIEAGAQWLHGRENDLFKYCNKYNLLSDILSEEGLGAFIRDDGFYLNDFFVKKINFQIGIILEECSIFSEDKNKKEYPISVEHFLKENFIKFVDEKLKTNKEKLLAMQLLDWHLRFQIIDNSCRYLSEVSAKAWGDYCFNGEDAQAHINFNSNGFIQIFDKLFDEIGKEKILFNKCVNKIDYENEKCIIECDDGTKFYTKHVIITFSLGVLKNLKLFSGNYKLPEEYQRTINDLGFGTINKIFLQFEKRWWGEHDGIQFIWTDESSYETEGWVRHLTGFDILTPGPANTLLGWVGGTGAIDMEKLTDERIVDDCLKVFTRFTNKKVHPPIRYSITRWHTNNFIRGSYGFTSTKNDKNKTSNIILNKPIMLNDIDILKCTKNLPIILFAGEACHRKYFSTAHGAFLSGIEQAQKILDSYVT